jgi:hypothetical protein
MDWRKGVQPKERHSSQLYIESRTKVTCLLSSGLTNYLIFWRMWAAIGQRLALLRFVTRSGLFQESGYGEYLSRVSIGRLRTF